MPQYNGCEGRPQRRGARAGGCSRWSSEESFAAVNARMTGALAPAARTPLCSPAGASAASSAGARMSRRSASLPAESSAEPCARGSAATAWMGPRCAHTLLRHAPAPARRAQPRSASSVCKQLLMARSIPRPINGVACSRKYLQKIPAIVSETVTRHAPATGEQTTMTLSRASFKPWE